MKNDPQNCLNLKLFNINTHTQSDTSRNELGEDLCNLYHRVGIPRMHTDNSYESEREQCNRKWKIEIFLLWRIYRLPISRRNKLPKFREIQITAVRLGHQIPHWRAGPQGLPDPAWYLPWILSFPCFYALVPNHVDFHLLITHQCFSMPKVSVKHHLFLML